MVKVSVVVPVYNPGSNMDDLIASVLDQSLPADAYEAIFVDDGSTDGTGAVLDRLAAEHDHIRVEHIPNSGWPGRPRNVGTDLARGEYVLYVDNDDYLAPAALEHLHATAIRNGADIVVGKVVGHDKFVARALFTEDRDHVTVAWPPLVQLLSPHKLFRTQFLRDHDIRFPEGRRRLEDHVFVMKAFFAAGDRISILASYACYHWMLRKEKDNASFAKMDPGGYFGNLREVVDIVEANTEGRERERLLAHWYRSKVLWRITGAVFLRREPEFNREIYDEVRTITVERFPAGIDRFLPFGLRARSYLLRQDDLDGIYALSRFEASLRAQVRVTSLDRRRDGADVGLTAGLRGYTFDPDGDRWLWHPPDDLRARLDGFDLDFSSSVNNGHVTPLVRAVADKTEVVLDATHAVSRAENPDGTVSPVITATLAVRELPPGEWQLVVPVRVSGFNHTAMTVRRGDGRPAPLTFRVDEDGRFERPSWFRRYLSGRAPKLLRRARKRWGRR